jgi:pSer/pThr/pTyr-binding forkhead associated (FHA) protein
MPRSVLGELLPAGGGDTIPLIRPTMKVGRRESCDVCLRFPNISSIHCELSLKPEGYWVIRDLNSTNGIKVNGQRLRFRPLRPGDRLTIGKRDYTIQYELPTSSQKALEAVLTEDEDILGQSLMEKAGLTKKSRLNPMDFDGPFDDDDDDRTLDDDDDD